MGRVLSHFGSLCPVLKMRRQPVLSPATLRLLPNVTWETHIPTDMRSPTWKTNIPSNRCSPTCKTHIPSYMCSLTWKTHIPSDMCSPPWQNIIPNDMCSPTWETPLQKRAHWKTSPVKSGVPIRLCEQKWSFKDYRRFRSLMNFIAVNYSHTFKRQCRNNRSRLPLF